MPDFPRAVFPNQMSDLQAPSGALVSVGRSGKVQTRNITQRGWRWTEGYPPILAGVQANQAFRAWTAYAWSRQVVFDIDYRLKLNAGGTVSSCTVNGAGQSGSSINVTMTGSLWGGDIIRIPGVNAVLMVTQTLEDSGALQVFPPIPPSESPADTAAVTFDGVKFSARIAEEPNWPSAAPHEFYAGLQLTFEEVIP